MWLFWIVVLVAGAFVFYHLYDKGKSVATRDEAWRRAEMVRQLETIDLDAGRVSEEIRKIKKMWGSEDYPRWEKARR